MADDFLLFIVNGYQDLTALLPTSSCRTASPAPRPTRNFVQELETLLWAICRLEHRADDLVAEMAAEVSRRARRAVGGCRCWRRTHVMILVFLLGLEVIDRKAPAADDRSKPAQRPCRRCRSNPAMHACSCFDFSWSGQEKIFSLGTRGGVFRSPGLASLSCPDGGTIASKTRRGFRVVVSPHGPAGNEGETRNKQQQQATGCKQLSHRRSSLFELKSRQTGRDASKLFRRLDNASPPFYFLLFHSSSRARRAQGKRRQEGLAGLLQQSGPSAARDAAFHLGAFRHLLAKYRAVDFDGQRAKGRYRRGKSMLSRMFRER